MDESFSKWLLTNGLSFRLIPKCDDEVRNLTDEALVEMARRSIKAVMPDTKIDEVSSRVAIALACARELDRRGKGHLLPERPD